MFEVTIKDLHLATYGDVYKYFVLFGEHVKQLHELEKSDYLLKNQSYNFERQPTPVASDEKDASGAVWDEKIHSANRTKTVDGLWRTRRNSSQGSDEEVEIPVPKTAFEDFVAFVTELKTSGKLSTDKLKSILEDFEIENVARVSEKPDLIPAIKFSINEFLTTQGK